MITATACRLGPRLGARTQLACLLRILALLCLAASTAAQFLGPTGSTNVSWALVGQGEGTKDIPGVVSLSAALSNPGVSDILLLTDYVVGDEFARLGSLKIKRCTAAAVLHACSATSARPGDANR